MFIYSQSTGTLWNSANNVIATGYSGLGEGKNNPAKQSVQGIGPIPEGGYTIGDPLDSEVEGPVVMRLTPDEGDQMYGRSGFLIHGDSAAHPGCASHGCIVLDRPARILIAGSMDRRLYVQP